MLTFKFFLNGFQGNKHLYMSHIPPKCLFSLYTVVAERPLEFVGIRYFPCILVSKLSTVFKSSKLTNNVSIIPLFLPNRL